MTKEMLYSAGTRLLKALVTWYQFQNKTDNANFETDKHWISEIYCLFENQVWDMIVEYRHYPTLCNGEQELFKQWLYDLSCNKSEQTLEEIINCFLDPGVVIDIFNLEK
jgi:hypothetical protein